MSAYPLRFDDALAAMTGSVTHHTGWPEGSQPYLRDVLEAHRNGDLVRRDGHLLMLLGFVTEMDVVAREISATELRMPPRKVRATRNTTIGGYTGWRAELTVASMLAAAGVEYRWGDRPDFEIDWRSSYLTVESTAVGLGAHQVNKDPSFQREQTRKAVTRGVRKHHAKPYEGPHTILFVDATMPIAVEAMTKEPGETPIQQAVLRTIARTLGRSGYGAVVVHTYFVETRSVSVLAREQEMADDGHGGVLLSRHADGHAAAVRWFGSPHEHRLQHVTCVLENDNCPDSLRELVRHAFLPASMEGRTFSGTVPPSNIY